MSHYTENVLTVQIPESPVFEIQPTPRHCPPTGSSPLWLRFLLNLRPALLHGACALYGRLPAPASVSAGIGVVVGVLPRMVATRGQKLAQTEPDLQLLSSSTRRRERTAVATEIEAAREHGFSEKSITLARELATLSDAWLHTRPGDDPPEVTAHVQWLYDCATEYHKQKN